MTISDLALLRKKHVIGTIATLLWLGLIPGIFVLLNTMHPNIPGTFVASSLIGAMALTAAWVYMDASYRGAESGLWGVLALITGPIGFLLYYVSQRPAQAVCLQCGSTLLNPSAPCPVCKRYTVQGRIRSSIGSVYSSLIHSLASGPIETTRTTVRTIALAFAATLMLGCFLVYEGPGEFHDLGLVVYIFSFAAYWVLVAWWVYLDATWRRMEGVPWAILTLLTNIVGLVTYLVIRYPDPCICPQCSASLATGLRRCPYCGAETEPTCPRCQAPIKPDWLYCPSCSGKLPTDADVKSKPSQANLTKEPITLTITGTVTDAFSGSPIPDAQIQIDSKSIAKSTASDIYGRYTLTDLPPKPYVVIASANGYATSSKPYTPSATGSAQIHFPLYPVTPI